MKNKIYKLSKILENTSVTNEFFTGVKTFFVENFDNIIFEIVQLNPFPPYFLNAFSKQSNESLVKKLSNSRELKQKDMFLIVNGHYIYPLKLNSKILRYLLVFNHQINKNYDEIKDLCEYINSIYKIVVNNYQTGFDESDLQNANLISHISHDINSMISLIKTNSAEFDESVSNKINYAEKMTKDILQYVREIQILDSEVKIEELLESVIQNASIPKNIEVSTQFNVKEKTINLDVELIDRALNELIKNAISAVRENNGKISIHAEIKNFRNIFFNTEFLFIIIEDNGTGINPDYLSFIKNPYFTTRKSEYHSGLGLSIADKVIKAHGGYLNIEITQNNQTSVTIYLPLQGKANE
jgi:signal transduction histidine kinase